MATYFKDETCKSIKENNILKISSTLLKIFDTFDTIATASTSVILSVVGFGLIVIPISTGLTCFRINYNY